MSLMTDDIRDLLGSTRTYTAPEAFGAASGRYFGMAIGDNNPLYSDNGYAREQGLRGVTAPLTLICETNQYANVPMAADGYAGHDWKIEIPGTRKVRGSNSYVFHRRLRPEDVVTATWSIDDIQEKTTRRGQAMLIVTSVARYTNQDGDAIADNTETIIFVEMEART